MSVHFRDVIDTLVPYQPGKPAEELMRERGLTSVIKLASNEGPWGPVPAAAAAISGGIDGLNRYPDGSCALLREALSEHHGVDPSQVAIGHGADSIIGNLSLAMLGPGDEVVMGWPSFPSYLLDARKMGATPVCVPLDGDNRYDLDAMLDAVTERTRIVYVCNPNNPTGTMVDRDRLSRFLESLPSHVLAVIDEAYFEYVTDPTYPDTIEEVFKRGSTNCLTLRTFSKIWGLAGLRVGYAVASTTVVDAIERVRNAFDVNTLAQSAAMASLTQRSLLTERVDANEEGRDVLSRALNDAGLDPVPSVTNFLCVPLGGIDTARIYDNLLDEGIIVRPLGPFGMADAIRVTVGTPDENVAAAQAIRQVLAPYA